MFYGVTTDYLLGRVASPTDSLVPITTEPLDPTIERIGYTDPALFAFWNELSQRPDLQLLFGKQKHDPVNHPKGHASHKSD